MEIITEICFDTLESVTKTKKALLKLFWIVKGSKKTLWSSDSSWYWMVGNYEPHFTSCHWIFGATIFFFFVKNYANNSRNEKKKRKKKPEKFMVHQQKNNKIVPKALSKSIKN